MRSRAILPLAIGAAILAAGCHGSPQAPVAATVAIVPAASSGASAAGLTPAAARDRKERAKKLFLAECSACHGERGRGDGPAAAVLPVPPRNFTAEKFKFRSTENGAAPRREDIFQTITSGLPGSFMPSFQFLPEEDRWLLVDHVRGLARIEGEADPDPVALGPEPGADAASIARGAAIYKKLECGKCHGDAGAGDGPSAKTLKDSKDRPIAVRDLTAGVFRRGATAAELNMRFRTGLDGTPMPAFGVTPAEGWDLAHYVQSLAGPKPAAPTEPLARGRRVVEERGCFACHVIEGRGGKVGPSLDVAAQKLETAWVKGFLAAPRKAGKLYPYMPYRMPDLGLSPDEIDGVLALFAKTAGRPHPDPSTPATPEIAAEKAASGQLLYVLKCAECHDLDGVVPLMEVKRQGPELASVAGRVRYDWVPAWIADPKAINPDSHMVKTNLTPEEIEQIRAFLWGVSMKRRSTP